MQRGLSILRYSAPSNARAAIWLAAIVAASIPAGLVSESKEQTESATIRSTRDGVYSIQEAARGRALYQRVCSYCHETDEFGPDYMVDWEGQPVGSLFELIKASMPEDNPGDLSRQQYSNLVAYLLQVNGLPAGEHELGNDPMQLDKIVIEGPFEKGHNPG